MVSIRAQAPTLKALARCAPPGTEGPPPLLDEAILSAPGPAEAPSPAAKWSWLAAGTLMLATAGTILTAQPLASESQAAVLETQAERPAELQAPKARPRDLVPSHALPEDDYVPGPRPQPGEWSNLKRYEVAVVGAGMSGLNTALRLQQEGYQVTLFERTYHVGGRVRTTEIENQKPLDLGAMRYIPARHHRVRALVEDELKLPTRDFVVSGEANLQYFRGVRLTGKEAAEHPEARPFRLTEKEKGKSVDELLALAVNSVIPNFQNLSSQDWARIQKAGTISVLDPSTGQTTEVPLHQLGLRNILARSLSQEAQELVTHSIGYRSFLENWDVGKALEELAADFKPGTAYKTPVAGMEAIPEGMAVKFAEAGGNIEVLHTLRAVDHNAKHGFLLEFTAGGEVKHVVADQVVLALPKVPLQQILKNSPQLRGTALEQTVDKVTANPMTRIFVTYDEPWWNELGIQSGRSLTDLPLGQVYYYGGKGDERSYVMSYSDGSNSEFWEGLQNPGEPGVGQRMTATPQLAEEFQRQIEQLHGRRLPKPTGFLYKRWSSDAMGGGYHTWKPGSKPWEASQKMLRPAGDIPLYVTGEAYSTHQGWIEGALETSEKVLEQIRSRSDPKTPPGQKTEQGSLAR